MKLFNLANYCVVLFKECWNYANLSYHISFSEVGRMPDLFIKKGMLWTLLIYDRRRGDLITFLDKDMPVLQIAKTHDNLSYYITWCLVALST